MNIDNVQKYCGYISQKHNSSMQHFYANGTDLHFKGNYTKAIDYSKNIICQGKRGEEAYRYITKLVGTIDGIIGKAGDGSDKGFLASQIQKAKAAGLRIEDDTLIFKPAKSYDGIVSTLKYPFKDMIFDIAHAVCNGLKKTPLSPLGDKISKIPFIEKGVNRVQAEKSYKTVKKILNQFVGKNDKDPTILGNRISLKTASKITKTAKTYATRDERTLNRLVTGAVGAALSSVDMYNISMLEKDDKNSAKKAKKERWKQEMTRIGISSALTFVSLGAIETMAKKSDLRSAIVVALSALAAEIISRVRMHKPLVPVSPEHAAEIAEKQEAEKKAKSTPSSVEITMTRINKNDKNNIYKDFTQNKNVTEPIQQGQISEEEKAKKAKKTNNILKWIGAAFIVSNIAFITSRWAKGVYAQKAAMSKVFKEFAPQLDYFAKTEDNIMLNEAIVNAIKEAGNKKPELITRLSKKMSETTVLGKGTTVKELFDKVSKVFTGFRDKILTKTITINLDTLESELNQLKKVEGSKDIESILEIYKKEIEAVRQSGQNCTLKIENPIPSAIYAGVTKLFKTLYEGLAIPARFVDACINRILGANTEKSFATVMSKIYLHDEGLKAANYRKELAQLSELFRKNTCKKNKYEKVTEHIKLHTRNFEPKSETGDLANLSRTMVTLISSWFYVNDFRNTVLIESGGKNIERAEEVTKDSVSFKLFNFLFNGTLMNLTNSLFKETLNKSLLGATIIPFCTEVMNEFLIRKTISRPMHTLNSREEIVQYDQERRDRKGPMGAWTRFFKRITGQKSLVEKYEAQQTKKNK